MNGDNFTSESTAIINKNLKDKKQEFLERQFKYNDLNSINLNKNNENKNKNMFSQTHLNKFISNPSEPNKYRAKINNPLSPKLEENNKILFEKAATETVKAPSTHHHKCHNPTSHFFP